MKIINELIVKDIKTNIDFFVNIFDFSVTQIEKENNAIRFAELKHLDTVLYLQNAGFTRQEFDNFPTTLSSSNLILFHYEKKEEFERLYKKIVDNNVAIFSELKETFYNTLEVVISTPDNYLIELFCDII